MAKNKPLMTIFLIVFIDLLGFGLILPLLPFIAEKFNANPFQIGLLGSAYSLFQFIASPILGRLSDRFGRKKILIISQLGSMAGFILLGIAHSLPLLFLSRIIDGITGGNISIAQAYIADVTTKEDRAKGMGLLGAAFGLGFILGPVIGGVLSQFGFAAPAFFAAFVSLFTVITTTLFLQETVDTKKTSRSSKTQVASVDFITVFRQQPLGLLIIVFFLLSLAFSGLQGTFSLWTQETFGWGATQNGYLFAYIGILAVISQIKILPWVTKKFGQRNTLVYSIPILAIGLLMIPLSVHLALLLLANALLVLGNSLANPTLQAIASENVDQSSYGGTLGILQSSASLGRIAGPVIGGELFYAISQDAPYIFSGTILIITFFILNHYLPSENSLPRRLLAFLHLR